MDSDSEPKLISLITQLLSLDVDTEYLERDSKFNLLIPQIISLVTSMDMELQLMSLVTQAISVFNSMDLESLPKPLSKLISLITQLANSLEPLLEFREFIGRSISLKPEPELISLIYQIYCHVIPMNSKWVNLISLCPQKQVCPKEGKFHVDKEVERRSDHKWLCLPFNWTKFTSKGEDATHFFCIGCNGKNHEEEYEHAPLEVKHPFHPKHSLHLVLLEMSSRTRECYCCDKYLRRTFYYCEVCDFAITIACVEKPPLLLAIDHPEWHEHTLALFTRQSPLTCNSCVIADLGSPIYMCPCGFVVHLRCLKLPRVVRISRHLHRISFTPSFDLGGDWSCVCQTKIDNDYGGYSCIKDGCSYAAHSRCATQTNVWDGKELEGVPEEVDEEILEPFVRISDGIIHHFSHEQHHLRLDVDTGKEYDENKQCQACIIPIYFGNFYSCMICNFILHETCANLSRKLHHPRHPHMLTLVGGRDSVLDYRKDKCSACGLVCTTGFFYECGKEKCRRFNYSRGFKLHVQCATISEPLVHEISHKHPLFLTSKPGEDRICGVCKGNGRETFNCIEGECEFALCFRCATIPQRVRYKHDKHILTLFLWRRDKYHDILV